MWNVRWNHSQVWHIAYIIHSCTVCTSIESCTDVGAIRLSNGSQLNEGRVEICLDGYWGSVCSNGWDEQDALVTCRQAGYQTLSEEFTS